MQFLWGSTALNIVKGTYTPPRAETVISQIPILPDPDNLSAVSTVIQQGGRSREQITFSIQVDSYAEYEAFLADWYAGTQRTFVGADSYSRTMVLIDVSTAERKLYPTRFVFSIALLEV